MNASAYSLYLDEAGDRGLIRFNPQYPVFGLCGVIVEDEVYRTTIVPTLDAFKVTWFGTARITLHYSAIMKRSGPYGIFRDRSKMFEFEQDLAALIARLPLAVVAAVVNKTEYASRAAHVTRPDPSWPRNLYHLATDFVMERFVEFLEHRQSVATAFIAEARGGRTGAEGREDRLLRAHYERRRSTPTQFYSAERFSALPATVEFRTKRDRIAGLELADLLAPPIATRTLRASDDRLLLWQAVKPKTWMRGDGRPGGIGLKTFPSRVGRDVMGLSP